MAAGEDSVDVVVSHYNRSQAAHIRYMAIYAMSYLCREPSPHLNVVFIDGSPFQDAGLKSCLETLGVQYLHFGRELSFGEAYNAGIKRTTNRVVVTLANDILIEPKQVRLLAAEAKGRVACAIPYLTFCDYGTQRERKLPTPRTCYPNSMTLNVNAFAREALESVGFIPEQMSGCYNDVVLFIRLREEGWSVILRNVGRVIHLGKQTLNTQQSSVSYETDAALFARQYPKYWDRGVVRFHKVGQRWTTRMLYRLLERLPPKAAARYGFWTWVWALEPYLSAERGTYRKGLGRAFRAFLK